MSKILIIDDEPGIRRLCSDVLVQSGHEVETAGSGEDGVTRAAQVGFDLVFCDINLPGMDGIRTMESLEASCENPPTVILITAYPSVATAVRGMKLGARDYVTKPFTPDELRMVAARALSEDELRRENNALRRKLGGGVLIGDSAAMRALRDTIHRVAQANATVLITGESGTGKELVARSIHLEGGRSTESFVPINCGALVPNLLESELFGHVRGAFTGADRSKEGLFRAASGGTLFLDEVGELPLELQPKLLRVLQEGEVKPVGSLEAQRVDTRVIAATNRNLEAELAAGRFREDLFYRLNVITIEVPPLRDRREDIEPLAEHFLRQSALRAQRPGLDMSDETRRWLSEQSWPGNVRQLENAVERAVVLTAGTTLERVDFAAPASTPAGAPSEDGSELLSLDELERRHILQVLAAVDGQKTKASAILGINRTTLWKKLRHYGVE